MPDIEPDAAVDEADVIDESPADEESTEEKDWKSEYEAQQRINRSLERKSKKDFARIQELEKSTPAVTTAEDAPDPEKIRAEIRTELQAATNTRLIAAEAKAALAGKVHKPATALRLLDLSEVEVDADGNVDTQALDDLIVKLLEDEPYLAVAQGTPQRFQGKADQGPQGVAKSEEQRLSEELAEATQKRDFTRAIGIKQRLSALAAQTK